MSTFMEDLRSLFHYSPIDDTWLNTEDEREDPQDFLDRISAWADRKLITFGLDKCGVLSLDPQELTLQGQPLPQRSTYKYLGIHLGAPVESDNLDSL